MIFFIEETSKNQLNKAPQEEGIKKTGEAM